MGEQNYSNYAAEPVRPSDAKGTVSTVLAVASVAVCAVSTGMVLTIDHSEAGFWGWGLAAVLGTVALVLNTWSRERPMRNVVLGTVGVTASVSMVVLFLGLVVALLGPSYLVTGEYAGSTSSKPTATAPSQGTGGGAAQSTQQGSSSQDAAAPQGTGQEGTVPAEEPAAVGDAQPAPSESDGYEDVDLTAFFADLDANQARVANEYKGKPIRFTGYATDISLNAFDSDEVDVKVSDDPPNGFDVLGVDCEITDPALKEVAYDLLPGDVVVVTGRFTLLHSSWINSFEVDGIERL